MTTDLSIHRLGDEELLTATRVLVRRSHAMTADLLLHLGEVDARRLYLGRALPSMFAFCVGELGFSEDVAYNHIQVSRLARRLPAVFESLRGGRVHLAGLRILAPHLTQENCASVLAEAAGKSKRDIEELAARLAPKPLAADSIRKLPEHPAPAPAREMEADLAAGGPPVLSVSARAPQVEADSAAGVPPVVSVSPGVHRAAITPLAEDTFKVQFTASRALRDKLREAQDLLRHSVPNGELAAIVERAIDLLIADVKKKRFGVGRKPKPSAAAASTDGEGASTRHVPALIRREVYERDGGRCTFIDAGGRRCAEMGGLEFDHVDGFARTGTHSASGIRLRCRAHNLYAAEQMYGRAFMEKARNRGRAGSSKPVAPDGATRPGATPDQPLLL
jgi:hypothetical protein